MKTVRLIDGIDYHQSDPEPKPDAFLITAEIAVRLQELDEKLTSEGSPPGGLRLISRLSRIGRTSPRAYRLLIDMLGEQQSFSQSLEELASAHKNSKGVATSRQCWLQNANADIKLITSIWPEVGEVMLEVFKRRKD